MLVEEDENLKLKIIDFNISRSTFCEKTKEKVLFTEKTGQLQGRSPEMLDMGMQEYDERVDLWGAAVCFYFSLTGRCPFEGESEEETVQNILRVDYRKLDN